MADLDLIFRSIINFRNSKNEETVIQKDLLKNFRALQQIVPEAPEENVYKIIYYFIWEYVKNCDTEDTELPSYEFIQNHFSTVDGNESVIRTLDSIKGRQPYVGQDYRNILHAYNKEQNVLKLEKALSNAAKIASTGMDIGVGKNKVRLEGVLDSVSYFARETKDLTRSITQIKTESQIVSGEDSEEVIAEYNKAEADPTEGIGINTWLTEMDYATNGLKNTELMMVMAYPGHCKTTFSMNMAYRALFGGWNTAYITLEMSFDEIRRHMYVLHSCNPKFKDKYPQYRDLVGNIEYNNVLYARLTKEERAYFFEICKDFNKAYSGEADCYGKFFVWRPEKTVTTVSDVEFKLRQYQQELQTMGRNLEFLVIDYISLMGADKEEKTKDHNETTNNVIKNLKQLCLTFNNGKGIRILSPHQANRESYKEALKNDGLYNLTGMSNAHETERSCDVAISVYKYGEDGDSNRLKFCCLKNRRGEHFKPFDACVNFKTGFIWNYGQMLEQSDSLIDISGVVG
jgi:KaiC/GvpD/RAD55 family RecA-like ATPase